MEPQIGNYNNKNILKINGELLGSSLFFVYICDMNNEFVPYDIALALKELGFDEDCLAFYNGKHLDVDIWDFDVLPVGKKLRDIGECPKAPLYQQVFRWFRDEHNIEVIIIPKFGDNGYGAECFKNGALLPVELLSKHNYREVEVACLRKVIEIVKK